MTDTVIDAVADANGVDPTELEPLYDTIDPEALDALFKPGVDGMITFTYEGHDVVVRGDANPEVDGTRVAVHPVPSVTSTDEDSQAGAVGK